MKRISRFLIFFKWLSVVTGPSVTLAQYLNPVTPVNPVRGLDYYYYHSELSQEPSGLDTLSTFLASGFQPGFSLSRRLRNDYFTFNFRGYIKVPVDTVYTFYTSSDDGSNLYIDTLKVVNNDGLHGETERSGTIRLKAGYHRIRVYYHEHTGGEVLSVSYSSDLIAKTTIPDSVLYRNRIPFPVVTGLQGITMFEEDSLSVPFKVVLPGGNPGQLTVRASSSNPASIPPQNLTLTGNDSLRTLKIKTLPGVLGNVQVALRFSSPGSNPGVGTFNVTVQTRSPSVSQVSDTFLVINNSITGKAIFVSDPDDAASLLTVTGSSGNQGLVPNSGITFSGTGATRFLSVNPLPNATGTSTITYSVKDPSNRMQEKSFVLIVGDTSNFRNADTVANPARGLDYLLARISGNNVLDFSTQLPDMAGVVPNYSLSLAQPQLDNFGLEFRGYVRIPRTAAYTFFTTSDDGSMLYIGNTEVVSNDGGHSAQERSGSINLKAGLHRIVVKYKEGNGDEVLEVRWAGGGIPKSRIPDSTLFRNGYAHPVIEATSDTVYAYKTWFTTIPFTLTDSDGDPAAATPAVFSYNTTVVSTQNMAVGGAGSARSLDFIPAEPGVVRLKVVMTDIQGLPAIRIFNVRVKDTTVIAGSAERITTKGAVVFPNPVRDRFLVSGMPETTQIEILDLCGIRRFSGRISEADLSRFPKGIYRVKPENQSRSLPLILE